MPAREREQGKHADRGEHREEAEDIRLGVAAAEHHEPGRGRNQHCGTSRTNMTLPARVAPALRSTALRAVPAELSAMPCVVIPWPNSSYASPRGGKVR